jgi:hypothetical protein
MAMSAVVNGETTDSEKTSGSDFVLAERPVFLAVEGGLCARIHVG